MAVFVHRRIFSIILVLILINFIHSNAAWLFTRGSKPLPIDGGWSGWTNWTSCHPNIETNPDYYQPWKGFLLSSKKRNCDSPKPVNGGKDCPGNQYRYKQCGCRNPLGLENGRVSNAQLSASTALKNFPALNGRLGSPSAWCAEGRISRFANTFFQVDFKQFVLINKLATEGVNVGRVSRYKIEYSTGKNDSWTLYRGSNGRTKIIRGNTRPNRVKAVALKEPFVAKSIRLYPVASYGSVCMKSEIYGCEFSCGELLTAPSGNIVGRSSSDVNQDCLWRIQVANTTVISLFFDIFYLPCENGTLEVRDASDLFSDSAVKQRFCGENEIKPYKFQGNDMWIRFRSNSAMEEVGFNMRYMSVCEKDIQLIPNEPYLLTSPNFPDDYPHNADCKWTITTRKHHVIQIEFVDFDIEESDKNGVDNCGNDYLQIEESGKIPEKYCNARRPNRAIYRNASHLDIKFISDFAIAKRGFKIRFISLDPNTVLPTTIKSTVAFSTKPTRSPSIEEIKTTNSVATDSPLNMDNNVGNHVGNGLQQQQSNQNRNSSVYPSKSSKTNDDDDDDTWTVIIIGAFSGIVLVLLIIVGGINIHRCVHNRDMYVQAKLGQKAHTDELAAKDKQRKLKADIEAKMRLLRVSANGDAVTGGEVDGGDEPSEEPCNGTQENGPEVNGNDENPDPENQESTEAENAEVKPAVDSKIDGSDVTSPAHSQISSGESSSVYVDCHEDLEGNTELEKYDPIDTETSTHGLEDCAETIV